MPTTIPPAPDTSALRSALEAAGSRCTPQRLAVYQYLRAAQHHPSAEQVYRAVRRQIPQISLATVYKALDTLVACGLVSKLTSVDGSALYDARHERHYHCRCLHTGRVEDVPTAYDPDLVDKLDPELAGRLAQQGFHLTGYRLELLGYFEPAIPKSSPSTDPGPERR